mmetsp:Transcript_8541/g.18800  ORF Transcript_8541/g.18800 Transcript_8541/m.18800 type:complete len:82 (-) Transcript_8541:80-325(-)
MLIPATSLLIVMITLASWTSYLVCGGMMVGGILLFKLQHFGQYQGWWTFKKKEFSSTQVIDNNEVQMTDVYNEGLDGCMTF